MAQLSYRANLSAAIYPMALSRAGRSVIVPQIDQNYDRRVDPTGEQKTPGIPQALFLENVVPTVEGYQSVGFVQETAFPSPANIVGMVELRDFNQGLAQVFFRHGLTTGAVYHNGTWRNLNVTGAGGKTFDVYSGFSYAAIRGKTYIYNSPNLFELVSTTFLGIPVFELSFVDDTSGTGATLTPSSVLSGTVAIGSSYGYLLLLKRNPLTGKETTLLWSSLLDETEFTPSLATGAGGGALENIEGTGQYLLSTSYGFRVYADNIVEAVYTGNARYPFRFSGRNADGVPLSSAALYGQRDSDTHFYVSKNRAINVVARNDSSALAPELSEFLERFKSVKDFYNAVTNTFVTSGVPEGANTHIAIASLGERYLLVSTGNATLSAFFPVIYSECYVFDRLLGRYGKLKIRHTHLFENHSATVGANTMVFLDTSTGKTSAMSLDVSNPYVTHEGVLLLGRFQGVRARRICLEEITFESAGILKDYASLHIFPSNDGKTLLPAVTPYETAASNKDVKQYLAHVEAQNIHLLVKGKFDLSNLEFKFHLGGAL